MKTSIAKQIWLSSGLLILGIVALAAIANRESRILERELNTLSDQDYPKMMELGQLQILNKDIQIKILDSKLNHSDLEEEFKGLEKEYRENAKALTSRIKDSEAKRSLQAIAERSEDFKTESLVQDAEVFQKLSIDLEKEEKQKERISESDKINIASLIIIVLGGLISAWITLRITGNLANLVARFSDTVKLISDTGKELSDVSTIVATSSHEQAAAVQETSAALNEIASMVSQTSRNAQASLEVSDRVVGLSQEGRGVMDQMVKAMEAIEQSNQDLLEIAKVIEEIGTKAAVINDIVFKTQLLSFNASIEAARAGEQGRGFSVVADEVGSLAKLSGNAANGIQQLLKTSQEKVQLTLNIIRGRVRDGNQVSESALKTFIQIADSVDSIQGQIRNSAEATLQQQAGLDQTSVAMKELDQSTKRNNQAVVSAQRVGTVIETESQKLKEITLNLEMLVKGKAA